VATKKVGTIEVEVPNDYLPLMEWVRWHYGKQKEFTRSFAENWETMFKAANGAGKTNILYWNLVTALLGVHPFQKESVKAFHPYMKKWVPSPPLRAKVLVTDFEHGMETIAYETLMHSTTMPDGSVIGPILPKSMIGSMPSKEDKSIRLRNGSVMWFMTSEQKRRQHSGTNFDILACDEEASESAYDESKRGLRNAKGGGRILHSFTPPLPDDPNAGPSWTRFKLYDPWTEGTLVKPDFHAIEAKMLDNPAITPEFVRKFSQGKSDRELRVQLHGEYPTWGKMVHPDFQDWHWNPKKVEGHLLPWELDAPWVDDDVTVEFALDWHSSKPAAGIWTYEDRDGNVVVFDELSPDSVKDKTISELSEIIRGIEGHPHTRARVWRVGDPKMKDTSNAIIRGFNAWDEFRNCGIYLNEGYNKQPEVGISIVNDFFRGNAKEHPRLFIRENCVNLRKALRYHYWVQRKDGSGEPDSKWSDFPICLRYILQRKSRKVKKGMFRRNKYNWGLTSYDGMAGFGPYDGHRLKEMRW
jgi:hypothetical protein